MTGTPTLRNRPVERIEILRGPQAVLFGLGTPSGAVNYRLKAPVWTPLARAEVSSRFDTAHDGGRWQLTAHGQWLQSRYLVRPSASLGDEIPGVAPWTAGLRLSRWLSGEAAAQRGEVWLGVQALGTRFANPENTVRLPREAVAELGARVPLAGGPLLGIGVCNLFDRRQVQAVTALDDVYPGPRRQVWVSAQFELP